MSSAITVPAHHRDIVKHRPIWYRWPKTSVHMMIGLCHSLCKCLLYLLNVCSAIQLEIEQPAVSLSPQ